MRHPEDQFDDAFINYVGGLVDRVHDLETTLTRIRECLSVGDDYDPAGARALADAALRGDVASALVHPSPVAA